MKQIKNEPEVNLSDGQVNIDVDSDTIQPDITVDKPEVLSRNNSSNIEQCHLLLKTSDSETLDQSETRTAKSKYELNKKLNLSLSDRNVISSENQCIAKLSLNQSAFLYNTEPNSVVKKMPLVLKCDPSMEGKRGKVQGKGNISCQAQPKLNVFANNELSQTQPKLVSNSQFQSDNMPKLNYEPSMEGKIGKFNLRNSVEVHLDNCQTQPEVNLGARPKSKVRAPTKCIVPRKDKFVQSKLRQNQKSKLELTFDKFRSKNALRPTKIPPKTPVKTSPTKILSKYKKSPKTIMSEIKHKLEGNRVKNLVKYFESGQKLGLSPKTPKSAKSRAFGAIKEKAVKAIRSKTNDSVSLSKQPKINTVFGSVKKSCDIASKFQIGPEKLNENWEKERKSP